MLMRVADLIRKLEGYHPDYLVILARDREGNGYSPCADVVEGRYLQDTDCSGQWDESPLGVGNPALCLRPVIRVPCPRSRNRGNHND